MTGARFERSIAAIRCAVASLPLLLASACGLLRSSPAPMPPGDTTPPTSTTTEASPNCGDPLGCFAAPELAGEFDATRVAEASGLAASVVNPDVLWVLDDGPGTRGVWALRTDGTLLGEVVVDGLEGRDTEDLAAAPCDGGGCLWIGDIGDNRRGRDEVSVTRVREPDLAAGLPVAPVPGEQVRLRYPDAPTDAEALLVDPASGGLVIVAKAPFDEGTATTGPTLAYAAATFADQVLAPLGRIPVPPASTPFAATLVGAGVTGGSARPGRVLLRTYDHVVEYVAPGPDAPLATLATWTAREVPSPPLPQPEAVAWAADGCGYWLVSEGVGELWRVACAE